MFRLVQLALVSAVFAGLMTTSPVLAQTPTGQAEPVGLRPSEVAEWIKSLGAETVGPVQTLSGQTWFDVTDGGLTWAVFFYACRWDTCEDVQFTADFAGEGLSEARASQWNRERRFLKAVWVPAGADGRARMQAQYDVVLSPGQGVGQLSEATAMWLDQLDDFAAHVGAAQGTR